MIDKTIFLNARMLRERYGVSHMWIARRLRDDPTFPAPVYFGRLRYWRVDEIEAWERSKIVARNKRE